MNRSSSRTGFASRTSRSVFALLAVATLGLSACGGDDSPSPSSEVPTSDSPTTDGSEIANPASVYCVEQGGTIEIVDEADGQVGYCNLPDGQRIEEWEYYRANQ